MHEFEQLLRKYSLFSYTSDQNDEYNYLKVTKDNCGSAIDMFSGDVTYNPYMSVDSGEYGVYARKLYYAKTKDSVIDGKKSII